MERNIKYKTKWEETHRGQNCKVKAIDSRTKRILAVVNVNVPVYTADDFEAIYGNTLKSEVENSAIEIAKNIAERTP